MRRFLVLGALVALVAGVVAASAGARTESRFSVVAKSTHANRLSGHRFLVRGQLLQPGDLDDIVGHFAAKFGRHGATHAIARFPGGNIKVQGNRNTNRIPIIGGSGVWNGAAGKLKTHNINKRLTLLTFVVVQ